MITNLLVGVWELWGWGGTELINTVACYMGTGKTSEGTISTSTTHELVLGAYVPSTFPPLPPPYTCSMSQL